MEGWDGLWNRETVGDCFGGMDSFDPMPSVLG